MGSLENPAQGRCRRGKANGLFRKTAQTLKLSGKRTEQSIDTKAISRLLAKVTVSLVSRILFPGYNQRVSPERFLSIAFA